MERKLTFKQKNYISVVMFILIFAWLLIINFIETDSFILVINFFKALFYVIFFRFAYWLIEWFKQK